MSKVRKLKIAGRWKNDFKTFDFKTFDLKAFS